MWFRIKFVLYQIIRMCRKTFVCVILFCDLSCRRFYFSTSLKCQSRFCSYEISMFLHSYVLWDEIYSNKGKFNMLIRDLHYLRLCGFVFFEISPFRIFRFWSDQMLMKRAFFSKYINRKLYSQLLIYVIHWINNVLKIIIFWMNEFWKISWIWHFN